jgi:arylsulfatase A-like enzyme
MKEPGISLCRPEMHPRRYVISANKLVQGAQIDGKRPTPSGRMLRSQRFKYCAYDEGKRRESLVDMQTDPGEMWNLVGESRFQDVLHQHRAVLREWCANTHDSFPVPTA